MGSRSPPQAAIRQLVDEGFLEIVRQSWKDAMRYRDGIDMRQGKAKH